MSSQFNLNISFSPDVPNCLDPLTVCLSLSRVNSIQIPPAITICQTRNRWTRGWIRTIKIIREWWLIRCHWSFPIQEHFYLMLHQHQRRKKVWTCEQCLCKMLVALENYMQNGKLFLNCVLWSISCLGWWGGGTFRPFFAN